MLGGVDLDEFSGVDIRIEKETHNLEYMIIIPVGLAVLLIFKLLGYSVPEEYTMALLGISFYTPLTWAFLDIYSLIKTGGRYIYKIKIQSYNLIVELFIGLFAYFMSQFTIYLLNLKSNLFSIESLYYFMIAYMGILIIRLIDRKIIEDGDIYMIIFGYIFSFVELFIYTLIFLGFIY